MIAASLVRRLARSFRLVVGALVGGALITAGALAVIVFVTGPDAETHRDGARAVRIANGALISQQAALRAYLATGDDSHLLEYFQARRVASAAVTGYSESLGHERDLATLTVEARAAQERWVEEFAETGEP